MNSKELTYGFYRDTKMIVTECPYRDSHKIGSVLCQSCENHKGINKHSQVVRCDFEYVQDGRITPEEKTRFKKIHDNSTEKLETPKNNKKEHWSKSSCEHLLKRFNEESIELNEAVAEGLSIEDIESEIKDCINFLLMLNDNLRGNK